MTVNRKVLRNSSTFIIFIEIILTVLYNTHKEYTVVECLPPILKERRFGNGE